MKTIAYFVRVAAVLAPALVAAAPSLVLVSGPSRATLDPEIPRLLSFEFKGRAYPQPAPARTLLVNGAETPLSGRGQSRGDRAVYSLSAGPLALVCTVSLVADTLSWSLDSVKGDDSAKKLRLRLPGALVSIPGAGATMGQTTGAGGAAYAFVADGTICAAVQQAFQFTAQNRAEGSALLDPGFHWRLADGARPEFWTIDAAKWVLVPVPCRTDVHFSADVNGDGTADWQDGALWVRTRIPQSPKGVRAFFDGGSWQQTHGAFPGDGVNPPPAYTAFTRVLGEMPQLVEAQRQICNMTDRLGAMTYEYVGWQGHGHDYGWPAINELPFNPALGTDADRERYKAQLKAVRGDLSFHVNMTDMTDNSPVYRRATGSHRFGTRASSTGQGQYGADVFGWQAWKISHYTDLPAALNRQEAFFKRFSRPVFMYQDVMIDYPKGAFGPVEEQYAKMREINNWRRLGTFMASEYYGPEKRTGGLFLMKNNVDPNPVDQFVCAGQTYFHYTHSRDTRPADYIWASLYSDPSKSGDFAYAGLGTRASRQQTAVSFLMSQVNGYCAARGLVRYDPSVPATTWGRDTVYSAVGNNLSVTTAGREIARLRLADGTLTGSVCIPRGNLFYLYSSAGGSETWSGISGSFDLCRLSGDGRVFVRSVTAAGSLAVDLEPGFAYVLLPAGSAARLPVVRENFARTADVKATSGNSARAFYVKADVSSIPVIRPAMMKDGQLRYLKNCGPQMAADGVSTTFWEPKPGDAAPAITFTFAGPRRLSAATVALLRGSKRTLTISADGQTLYKGPAGKALRLTPMTVRSVTLTFDDSGDALAVAEISLY